MQEGDGWAVPFYPLPSLTQNTTLGYNDSIGPLEGSTKLVPPAQWPYWRHNTVPLLGTPNGELAQT